MTAGNGAMRASRLPALGRRGEGWVALQAALLAAIIATGLLGPAWPAGARLWLALAACVAAAGGALLLISGGLGLGGQLTAMPKPVPEGTVRQRGVYGLVRHPMYGGVLLLALAWSLIASPVTLVPWLAAAFFLEAKRRREEAWLVEQHPDYEDYRRRVRHRFMPFVW